MEKLLATIHSIQSFGKKRSFEVVENLGQHRLWQRQLKNVVATTIFVSICLIPRSSEALGRAAYLGAITTVFAHPGRRFGQLVEALILALAGTSIGLAWSLFGLYSSSLVVNVNPAAAYSIKGAFLACALLFHGFLRSYTPRLFIFVLLLIIVSVVLLTSTASAVTSAAATQILYPIFAAAGVILIVNLILFPEFSSSFLGETTIETLHDTAEALRSAGQYFTVLSGGNKTSPETPLGERGKELETGSEGTKQPPKKSLFNGALNSILWPSWQKSSDTDRESEDSRILLQDLVGAKAKLRSKLSTCKTAQTECAFEIAFAVLPPRSLKPISVKCMKKLVANVVAVIGACESRFAILGEGAEPDHDANNTTSPHSRIIDKAEGRDGSDVLTTQSRPHDHEKTQLDLVKPKREIEFGDASLLQLLLERIKVPYTKFNAVLSRAISCVTVCVAYSYDVPKLPSGAKAPKGLAIEEVDLYLEELSEALRAFDTDVTAALEGAVETQGSNGKQLDVMPREEIFLVASFVLNLRQAATHIEEMLKTSRSIVLQRQSRHDRRRFYAPRIKWSKWLDTGGEELEALPASGRKRSRSGGKNDKVDVDGMDTAEVEDNLPKAPSAKHDLERGTKSAQRVSKPHPQPIMTPAVPTSGPGKGDGLALRLRGKLADGLEWAQDSDDFLYAFKLSVAVFIVTWPAFISVWNQWYSLNRGLWAALQLVLVAEVSIGSSVMMFILRGIGTTLGCLWGWAALEARNGNRVVVVAMVCVGLIPSTYVQLGSNYPKAGMVCIVSICVVSLSTELQTVPGTATENFLKRWLAFIIGGVVALVIEMAFLPVKARTRLVESLTAAIRQISEMETCVAAGIEEEVNLDVYNPKTLERFERASKKANGALTAAETSLPFCSIEPRIKGSFEGLAEIYSEILFVLHQIVDRMDNLLQLRTAYGAGPLEELNAQLYPYRRNIAGSINLTLFAVQSSLTTKLALPQFFPSARLANLRLINRVRELVQQRLHEPDKNTSELVRHQAVRRNYIAWDAASAARAEIIEYLEELIDLTKLLVGANEFRSGLFMRSTYDDYVRGLGDVPVHKKPESSPDDTTVETQSEEKGDGFADEPLQRSRTVRRRRLTTIRSSGSGEEKVPASLQRIQSRKMEAGIRRQTTNEG
ncbi:MAG: hypothetical protein Q9178_004029 [Gyalolechia marmorata]